jgi:hypothetical protein
MVVPFVMGWCLGKWINSRRKALPHEVPDIENVWGAKMIYVNRNGSTYEWIAVLLIYMWYMGLCPVYYNLSQPVDTKIREEKPQLPTPAYAHLITSYIGALAPFTAVILMKLKGEYSMDIGFPGISDSARQGAGYYVLLVSAFVVWLTRLWTREVIYRRFWSVVRGTRSKANQALMFVMYILSHADSLGAILLAYYSVGDNQDKHNLFTQIAFLSATLCQLLTVVLYYSIDLPWMRTSRNVRSFAVAFSIWFMYTHASFPTENLRIVSYEEACMRINKPLADFCLKSFADCEPIHYEWKRSDGRPISAPYESYHENTFVRLQKGEKGELVRKTSLKSMQKCALRGWVWAVGELLCILVLGYAESMWAKDLRHLR